MSIHRKALGFFAVIIIFGGYFTLPLLTGAQSPQSASPTDAQRSAASLYLSPTSGAFSVGSTFTVSIYVNTGGQAINAVEANLSFPRDKLQVVSPTAGTSFVKTWVAQPSFSNSQGTLNFQGALPSPGITTSAGLLSTISFRVIDTGSATVRFLDSSRILKNDGAGTDILGQTTNGIYTLTVPPPAGPAVTSPTNPDQSAWYNTGIVSFEWAPADAAEGYSYSVSPNPVETPDNISEGTRTSITYNDLLDGVHYFHIKALRSGVWGGVTHYAVRIDRTTPAAFDILVSPSDYTSSQNPVFQFKTTDALSGIDHYELKIIPLDPENVIAEQDENQPFFIEATTPYLAQLNVGKYDVVVRAFDVAGNFYQSVKPVSVVNPLLRVLGNEGIRIRGTIILSWPILIVIGILLIFLFGFLLVRIWRLHRVIEGRLSAGAAAHPEIAAKLAELKQKQKEYEDMLKRVVAVVVIAIGAAWAMQTTLLSGPRAHAAEQGILLLNPPTINLYPSSIGNDEVLYLGGWTNSPGATVNLYIERSETGETFTGTAVAGPDGNWFYSFPQLLDTGHYAAWAQAKKGTTESPPSSRVSIDIAETALRFGSVRLDFARLYLLLFLLCLAVVIALIILISIYRRRIREKNLRLESAIRAAEESLRRGFSVLARDIEAELAGVQKLKLRGGIPEDERMREEKLRRDLEDVRRHIGHEIWRIEQEERG